MPRKVRVHWQDVFALQELNYITKITSKTVDNKTIYETDTGDIGNCSSDSSSVCVSDVRVKI